MEAEILVALGYVETIAGTITGRLSYTWTIRLVQPSSPVKFNHINEKF